MEMKRTTRNLKKKKTVTMLLLMKRDIPTEAMDQLSQWTSSMPTTS
jgi:hypothetical protein